MVIFRLNFIQKSQSAIWYKSFVTNYKKNFFWTKLLFHCVDVVYQSVIHESSSYLISPLCHHYCHLVNLWINEKGGIHKLRRQDFANFWPPLRRQVFYISLCSSIDIWLTPLPLACLRSLWMPPKKEWELSSKRSNKCRRWFPLILCHISL